MATLPIDPTFARQAPYTSKPNIRVVFLPGPAQTAMAGELAKLPAETQEATLEELEIAALARDVIALAKTRLSTAIYPAFLRWADAAFLCHISDDIPDEENERRLAAADEALNAVHAVSSVTGSDYTLKTYLAEVEAKREGLISLDGNGSFNWSADNVELVRKLDAFVDKAFDLGDNSCCLSVPICNAARQPFLDAIAELPEPAPVGSDFRSALDGSHLANQRFNSLPKDYEDTHPAEYEIEADLVCDASEIADKAVPTSWTEYLELLDHMSCKGQMFVTKENAARLRCHADRLLSVATNGDGSFMQADQNILAAFNGLRREMRESYDRDDMTPAEEDTYFARLNAYEHTLTETRATTIEGVIAKMRLAFGRLNQAAWSDHALMDPAIAEFREGLQTADPFERMAWGAIEDLARIGGVNLSEARA